MGSINKIFLIFCICFPFIAAQAQYRFDNWTTENGLPQNSVYAIVQTRDNYIWLATLDGLVRFDGVRFTEFNKANSPGIESNRFVSLFEDVRGDLWAGTENSGITRYHEGRFTTYTTNDGLLNNFAGRIVGDISSNVLVLSERKLMRFNGSRFEQVILDGLDLEFLTSFWEGDFCWGFHDNKFYRLAGGKLTSRPFPKELSGLISYRVEEDYTGDLWTGTLETAITRVKDNQVTKFFSSLSENHRLNQNFERTTTYLDSENHPWRIEVGLDLVRTLIFQSSGEEKRISFQTLLEDREGNLWLGTSGSGLYRIRKQVIRVYSTQHGLVDKNVYPVFEDTSGAVWIGAWNLGVSRFKDGKFTNYTNLNGLASGLITAIGEDAQGRIWVSTHSNTNAGLRIFRDEHFILVNQIVPDHSRVVVIFTDSRGVMWFGTQRGLVRYQDGASTLFTTRDGLADDDVRVIIGSSKGELWIGGYASLTKFKDEKFESVYAPADFPVKNLRALYKDNEDVLWIGTYDSGLLRLENGKFTQITTRNGLFNNGVFQIFEDKKDWFWISSNKGIYRVRRQELNEFAAGQRKIVNSIGYGKSDGLLNSECNGGLTPAGTKTHDGKLWFPTQDGVAVIDPETVIINLNPPSVAIEAVSVDNQPVDSITFLRAVEDNLSRIELNPDSVNLEIQYTALSFINSENLRFKYKLEGWDEDWVEAETRRTAYYSRISPGNYTFRVIAANSDGVWNEEGKSLKITLLPRFYQTWWFMILSGLMITALIGLTYGYRVAQLEKINAAKTVFAQQLIESQEQERKRIAVELHDSIGQSLIVIRNRALMSLNSPEKLENMVAQMEEISEAASDSISEVRQISHNLHPHQIEHLGLATALKTMIETTANSSAIDFHAEIDDLDDTFSKEEEINLYRIVQEALNNILKHSAATEAKIKLKKSNEFLSLRVEDNGRGFNSEGYVSKSGGLGLTSIAERAKMLGTQIEIHSVSGKGTILSAKVKLPEK